MRLNYYRFPDGIADDVRAQNGAEDIENTCIADPDRWNALDNPHINCPYQDGDWGCRECSKLKCIKAGDTVGGISVTRAKQLLNEFGGSAWTEHLDRDGGCFETTDIKLTGNNSRFQYNRHL